MEGKPTSSQSAPHPGAPERRAPTLRPAQPGDAAFLRALYASTRRDELSLLPLEQRETFLELQWRARETEYRARHPGAQDNIVCVGETAAGRLLLACGRDEVFVVDIALVPDFRGRGIGSRLLGQVLAGAARRGTVVHLHVALSNPAVRLYRRLGFSQVGQSGIYALMERGTKFPP